MPDVRLIAILRNPIDRAQSAMIHHIASSGLAPDSDLLDLVEQTPAERDKLGLVSGGGYAESLEPYRDTFGDKLLVLLHDDIETDPHAFYRRAADHVGATRDFVPPDLEAVRFSYRQRPGAGRRGTPPLTIEKRRRLYEYFVDDLAKLENMLGRDLSIWEPDDRL
jgi:hypothetical protein